MRNGGQMRSENAGMSSEKPFLNKGRLKLKGSYQNVAHGRVSTALKKKTKVLIRKVFRSDSSFATILK